jgi:dipeptidyl aminopeptidase/acylaminoacyl peptidase
MKFLFLLPVFMGYAVIVFPQSLPYSAKENFQVIQPDWWDISKYIWGQTHLMPNKGHKPNVDFKAIDNWIGIGNDGDLSISKDGKYFSYSIENKWNLKREKLIVQSTLNTWKKEFTTASTGFFSCDGKQFIYQDKDSLCFIKLGESQCRYMTEISSYKNIANGKLLAWQVKSNLNRLVLLNLSTEREMQFDSVTDFAVDSKGTALVLRTVNAVLRYVDLGTGKVKDIWTSTSKDVNTSSFNFDSSGKQFVFLVEEKQLRNAVWYYKTGMEEAVVKLNNELSSSIQQADFTDNGRYILLTLKQPPAFQQPKPDVVNVAVWSYLDTTLQSNEISKSKESKCFLAFFNLEKDRLITLENRHEKLKALSGDFAVVGKIGSEVNGDRFWEPKYREDSNYLVSLKDGIRKLLKTSVARSTGFWFSPQGNYLVYFDPKQQCNYFSYNLHTGQVVNISSEVPAWLLGRQNIYEVSKIKPNEAAGFIGWIKNDVGVLVHDNYDIWLLDVTGKNNPINITNGYGRSHQVRFDLEKGFEASSNTSIVAEHQSIILKAFDKKNKYNGFFRKQIGKVGEPELLYLRPCIISGSIAGIRGMQPLKANSADIWIVKRQSTIEAPNYFLTSDFKNYSALTDIQSHKQYNWLKAELHAFRHLDGSIGQGILYKPENFDPTKKYPVLIIFYRDYANRLYQFPTPAYNWSAITPAESPILFLNYGYLVFIPDMYVSPRKYGPSALNVVEGAAKYLQQLPFVDGKHIGGAAHSWSAKLGTYIFTHSHTLAAMVISEGFLYGNLINTALSVDENNGESNLEAVENEFKFGNLWENKATWLDQMEVLHVDKASCPLLVYCNNKSLKDYQNQTMQLFTALRRLEKPCWWLKYDKSGHTLEGDDAKDYTLRYIQFFDHYLKGAPAPRWMTEGIPAAMKGIETGYELNPAGSCAIKGPNKCRVCEKWNLQYKKTP